MDSTQFRLQSFCQICNENNMMGCRMHDLIHDLVSTLKFCQVKDNCKSCTFSEETCHVSLFSQHLNSFRQTPDKIFYTLDKRFHSLNYISFVDLSSSGLLELPSSIEELKLLRYLDLSRNEIKELPDSICNLFNLQTLKLLGCRWLSKLPDIVNLVNLLYLELEGIFCSEWKLPPSLIELTILGISYDHSNIDDTKVSGRQQLLPPPEFHSIQIDGLINGSFDEQSSGVGSYQILTLKDWILLVVFVGIDVVSFVLDQLASAHNPEYALFGMVLAYISLIGCIAELVSEGRKKRVHWRLDREIPWFYYSTQGVYKPLGTIYKILGLLFAMVQCFSAAAAYICYSLHVNNPFKFSLYPITLCICTLCYPFLQYRRQMVLMAQSLHEV